MPVGVRAHTAPVDRLGCHTANSGPLWCAEMPPLTRPAVEIVP